MIEKPTQADALAIIMEHIRPADRGEAWLMLPYIIERFNGEGTFKGWVRFVLARKMIAVANRENRHRKREVDATGSQPVSPAARIDDRLDAEEAADRVSNAIAAGILGLAVNHGHEAVATSEGIQRGTIRSRCRFERDRLRSHLRLPRL